MTTSGPDICRQLFDCAPTWLETLSAFTEDVKQRKGSLVEGLATPELSTRLTTTVGSTAESGTAGSVPGYVRRADHFAGSHTPSPSALKPNSMQHVEVSRSRGNSSPKVRTVVTYDADAQERLADTVKSMDRLIYHIKKSGQRQSMDGILRALSKSSNTVEDAAFQLLRNGSCQREALHAYSMIKHLYEITRSEFMQEQLDRRLTKQEDAVERDDKVLVPTMPTMPRLLVDDMDDDGGLDAPLPAIRLTSRLAR